MDTLKILVDEIQNLVDENRQYEQRFRTLLSEMDAEVHRLLQANGGSAAIVLTITPRENWGRNLDLEVKTRVAVTKHAAHIVQTGKGEYLLADEFGHEATVRDGASALGTLLEWLIGRIREQKGELAGGTLTSRLLN